MLGAKKPTDIRHVASFMILNKTTGTGFNIAVSAKKESNNVERERFKCLMPLLLNTIKFYLVWLACILWKRHLIKMILTAIYELFDKYYYAHIKCCISYIIS